MFFKNFKKANVKWALHNLAEQDMLFSEQFGFQAGHSTNHALIEIEDRIKQFHGQKVYYWCIYRSFENI